MHCRSLVERSVRLQKKLLLRKLQFVQLSITRKP